MQCGAEISENAFIRPVFGEPTDGYVPCPFCNLFVRFGVDECNVCFNYLGQNFWDLAYDNVEDLTVDYVLEYNGVMPPIISSWHRSPVEDDDDDRPPMGSFFHAEPEYSDLSLSEEDPVLYQALIYRYTNLENTCIHCDKFPRDCQCSEVSDFDHMYNRYVHTPDNDPYEDVNTQEIVGCSGCALAHSAWCRPLRMWLLEAEEADVSMSYGIPNIEEPEDIGVCPAWISRTTVVLDYQENIQGVIA